MIQIYPYRFNSLTEKIVLRLPWFRLSIPSTEEIPLPDASKYLQYVETMEGNQNSNSTISLPKSSLPRINLSGRSLKFADLSYAFLAYADLSNTKIDGAILVGSILNNTNLQKAELNSSNLSKAKLNHANLSWAELNYANLLSTELNHTNLIETQFNYANLMFATFHYAYSRNIQLGFSNINNADFRYFVLIYPELYKVQNYKNAKLSKTTLILFPHWGKPTKKEAGQRQEVDEFNLKDINRFFEQFSNIEVWFDSIKLEALRDKNIAKFTMKVLVSLSKEHKNPKFTKKINTLHKKFVELLNKQHQDWTDQIIRELIVESTFEEFTLQNLKKLTKNSFKKNLIRDNLIQ